MQPEVTHGNGTAAQLIVTNQHCRSRVDTVGAAQAARQSTLVQQLNRQPGATQFTSEAHGLALPCFAHAD